MASVIDPVYFREKLNKLRDEILDVEKTGDEAARTVELDQSRVGRLSRMDALQAQAMSIETKRRRGIRLQQIAAALGRIERGDFGLCIQCELEIDPKRLEFDPAALKCIACANQGEQ